MDWPDGLPSQVSQDPESESWSSGTLRSHRTFGGAGECAAKSVCRSSNVIRRLLRTSERVLRAKTYELRLNWCDCRPLLWSQSSVCHSCSLVLRNEVALFPAVCASVRTSRRQTHDELQLRSNGGSSVRVQPSSGWKAVKTAAAYRTSPAVTTSLACRTRREDQSPLWCPRQ